MPLSPTTPDRLERPSAFSKPIYSSFSEPLHFRARPTNGTDLTRPIPIRSRNTSFCTSGVCPGCSSCSSNLPHQHRVVSFGSAVTSTDIEDTDWPSDDPIRTKTSDSSTLSDYKRNITNHHRSRSALGTDQSRSVCNGFHATTQTLNVPPKVKIWDGREISGRNFESFGYVKKDSHHVEPFSSSFLTRKNTMKARFAKKGKETDQIREKGKHVQRHRFGLLRRKLSMGRK